MYIKDLLINLPTYLCDRPGQEHKRAVMPHLVPCARFVLLSCLLSLHTSDKCSERICIVAEETILHLHNQEYSHH